MRQLGPMEVFASAPGGSDSIVSETLAPPDRLLGRKSQLGVQDAQEGFQDRPIELGVDARNELVPRFLGPDTGTAGLI